MHYHVLWLNMRSSEGEGLPLSPSGGGVKRRRRPLLPLASESVGAGRRG